jgi:hypothetical protein
VPAVGGELTLIPTGGAAGAVPGIAAANAFRVQTATGLIRRMNCVPAESAETVAIVELTGCTLRNWKALISFTFQNVLI